MANPDVRSQARAKLLGIVSRQVNLVVDPVHTEADCPGRRHKVNIVEDLALTGRGNVDLGHDGVPLLLVLLGACLAGLRSEHEEVGLLGVFSPTGALLRLENSLRIYFPLESR